MASRNRLSGKVSDPTGDVPAPTVRAVLRPAAEEVPPHAPTVARLPSGERPDG